MTIAELESASSAHGLGRTRVRPNEFVDNVGFLDFCNDLLARIWVDLAQKWPTSRDSFTDLARKWPILGHRWA